MSDKRIDLPTVLEDLQAIVAEKGDGFVYKPPNDGAHECVYVEDGETDEPVPSCIVGHVLARRGLLMRSYAIDNSALSDNSARGEFGEDFTWDAVVVLAAAQKVQDDGVSTWGDALIAAKEAAESVSA